MFGQKNTKKALVTYRTAFNNRFDTSGNILNYPERPVITTRMAPIIHSDEIGTGNNGWGNNELQYYTNTRQLRSETLLV